MAHRPELEVCRLDVCTDLAGMSVMTTMGHRAPGLGRRKIPSQSSWSSDCFNKITVLRCCWLSLIGFPTLPNDWIPCQQLLSRITYDKPLLRVGGEERWGHLCNYAPSMSQLFQERREHWRGGKYSRSIKGSTIVNGIKGSVPPAMKRGRQGNVSETLNLLTSFGCCLTCY